MTADALAAVFAEITSEELNAEALERFVWHSGHGAVVTFRGVVRDHDGGRRVRGLDYEAHPDAERLLRACCEETARRTGLPIAAAHRVGTLGIGDTALIASVAAAHRHDAFVACSALVDEIKARVPIWKRQHFEDGVSEWVGL